MKIIVPTAGAGSRFLQAGYTVPKPFLDVKGLPMVVRATEMFKDLGEFVFLVRKEHLAYADLLPGEIVVVPDLTQGAAATVLLAEELIRGQEILIVNSDQIISYSSLTFEVLRKQINAMGIIFVFPCQGNPDWSYAKIEAGEVTKVAEKVPISDWATAGAYYWRIGDDFIRCARTMMEKDLRVNNEFYVCPVYNELLLEGGRVLPFQICNVHQLGTPESYETYIQCC